MKRLNVMMAMMAMMLWSVASACGLMREVQAAEPIRVVVWDERQPRQKQAYPDFLGNQIARALSARDSLSGRSPWMTPGRAFRTRCLRVATC